MMRPKELRESDDVSLGRKSAPVRRTPNAEIQALRDRYLRLVGLPPWQETPLVPVSPELCARIAAAFEDLPHFEDSETTRAYAQLVREIESQYDFLRRHIRFEPYGDGDPVPYRNSAEMMEDLLKNRHLWVYDGGEDHAILSRKENWMFRAVHDVFGHAAEGFSFGPRGEENAWIEHSKLLSPLARKALTTETRGQNSWVNCGPDRDLPPRERRFAEQKGALLPEEYRKHPAFAEAYEGYPEFL